MNITKEQVKAWDACRGGYAWFLEKFPQGGVYAAVHQALIDDNRFVDAQWLVDKMYSSYWNDPSFPKAETAATDKLTGSLNSMEFPSADVDGDSDGDSSGVRARIGSSGVRAQIGS
ncbi:hypothetical protein NM75_09075, partial [Dickeya fangzhongdai]